ncbi:MAG TPA: PKD domain-containing protein, partial [Thermoplasmatales archaeon]|nr:PKD domain-containing protein [Thermoplasmatales archaeon]
MRRILLIILALSAFALVGGVSATSVYISSPPIVAAGKDFFANVTICNVTNFNSADCTIYYNSSIIQIEEIYAGVINGTEINLNYSINDGICRLFNDVQGIEGVNGSGYLAKIKFLVIGTGTDYIDINGNLSDIYGSEIEGNWTGKLIKATSTILEVNSPSIVKKSFYAFINISNIKNLSSINMTLVFNKDFIEFVGIENGSIEGKNVSIYYNEIEEEIKILALTNASGNGTIAKIKFKPIENGTTSLNIKDVTISNFSAGEIFAYIKNESFSIQLNILPFADFIYTPLNPTTADLIQFTSSSYDSDGYIVNYTWDFGDGSFAYGESATHQYSDDGIYNVVLVVRDVDGATDSITKQINVSNVPPHAITNGPYYAYVNESILFNASMSYDSDGYIVNYTWDFGDGSFAYGMVVNHEYNAEGNYTVVLTITDDDNSSSINITYAL